MLFTLQLGRKKSHLTPSPSVLSPPELGHRDLFLHRCFWWPLQPSQCRGGASCQVSYFLIDLFISWWMYDTKIMCVCIYVYIYICVYIYIHLCIYICVCVYLCMYIYTIKYMYVYIYMIVNVFCVVIIYVHTH